MNQWRTDIDEMPRQPFVPLLATMRDKILFRDVEVIAANRRGGFNLLNDPGFAVPVSEIVAWMPLPAPFNRSGRAMNWRDLSTKLTVMRQRARLTQPELAQRSGVGWKTVSSFETGGRVRSIKLAQIEAMAMACGVTLAEFFGASGACPPNSGEDASDPDDATMDTIARTLAKATPPARREVPTPQSSLRGGWTRLLPWGS